MNILAIGSHPDDIEFGCGGTLIKYVKARHNVYLLVLTDGSFGGDPGVRRAEQGKSAKFMGAKDLFWGNLKDTEVTNNRDLIIKIEEVVRKVAPDLVFMGYYKDVHQDHRATSLAGISATRYIKEVLFYEVPTTFSFEPEIFVDIKNVMNKKTHLLKLHASQLDKTRVKNLTIVEIAHSCANFRGFQGRVKYAEGFKSLRSLREVR
jgi:LmbE family N-acetylglucosaminyl deacetylase